MFGSVIQFFGKSVASALASGSRVLMNTFRCAAGDVYVSWWSSYPLLITFLIILLVTAVLLFAAIVTLVILENKNHKAQVELLMAELARAYERGGIQPEEGQKPESEEQPKNSKS